MTYVEEKYKMINVIYHPTVVYIDINGHNHWNQHNKGIKTWVFTLYSNIKQNEL